MKKILLNAFTLGLVITVNAQTTDEERLNEINNQFIQNFLNNDTVAHNRIIHPTQFLFIGTNGNLADRNQYMKIWSHGYDKTVMPEFILVEKQIRIFGNMALIVAKTRDKTLRDGTLITGETRYTDTYIKENGEWKCVQVQLTRMAK